MRRTRPQPRGGFRGSPQVRLRIGFVLIAMVLSLFGARLVQLQGVDPGAYAEMAAAEGLVDVVLPAARGDILDRNGQPLAESVDGLMVVADPAQTRKTAPRLAKLLASRLDVDYIDTLTKLRTQGKGDRFQYIARRVPSTLATDVVKAATDAGFKGVSTRLDPIRDYPGRDLAANLVGSMGVDEPLAGFERTFDKQLGGTDGSAKYEVGVGAGARIPLGENTTVKAVNGKDLHTTIDRDLQWYTQKVVNQTVEDAGGDSGLAIVMDTRTGDVLALADDPTYDASKPITDKDTQTGSVALQDAYEPGSVEKVLTMSSLIDAGKVTPRTKLTVPPVLNRQDRPIHDYFEHPTIRLTLTGVLAKSSNIGTVLAADKFDPGQLRSYLTRFGLGQPTNVGIRGENPGILPDPSMWTSQTQDRIAFGQSVSVNALQMITAVNAIANKGVLVSPSVIEGSATTEDGKVVGTDTTTRRQVVSPEAARATAKMMERVLDPDEGVAPRAAVPGYRVAGKTGTAQRVNTVTGGYDDTVTVSFAGFAPADDARLTIYVVVQNPRVEGAGGGSIAGPAFAKLMSYALRRYQVPPTGTTPSQLPITW